MGHIVLCHAWYFLKRGGVLPKNIQKFVLDSLQSEPPPPAPLITDCLFIIGLSLRTKLHIDNLLVPDKRWVNL